MKSNSFDGMKWNQMNAAQQLIDWIGGLLAQRALSLRSLWLIFNFNIILLPELKNEINQWTAWVSWFIGFFMEDENKERLKLIWWAASEIKLYYSSKAENKEEINYCKELVCDLFEADGMN